MNNIIQVAITTDWTWYVSTAISLLGFLVVCIQLHNMRKQQISERKILRIEHSIKISRDFSEIINDELGFIDGYCAGLPGYHDTIATVDESELKYFDITELNSLIKKYSNLKKYISSFSNDISKNLSNIATIYINQNVLSQQEFENLMGAVHSNWSLSEKEEDFLKQDFSQLPPDKQKRYIVLNQKSIAISYYSAKLMTIYNEKFYSLLNKLEAFSMQINSNIVDEDLIYRSLHQLFIKVIKELYPYIANLNNSNNADKYYTHIIELYSKWVKRYKEDCNKEKNKKICKTTESSKI